MNMPCLKQLMYTVMKERKDSIYHWQYQKKQPIQNGKMFTWK
jgi:hypothetical protein